MGYFASGWPKTFLLPEHHDKASSNPIQPDKHSEAQSSSTQTPSHPVHAIHLDPSSQYALTVSSRALHIWSAGQHRLLLARFILSDLVFQEEGPLIDAVWSPSSTSIIAAFRSGLILFFSVTPHQQSGSLLHFNDSNINSSTASTNDQLLNHNSLNHNNANNRNSNNNIYNNNRNSHNSATHNINSNSSNSSVQASKLYPLEFKRVTELRIAHADSSSTCMTACPAGALVATSQAALACIAWDGDILWRAHIPELLRNNDAMLKMGVFTKLTNKTKEEKEENKIIDNIQNEVSPDNAGGILSLCYDQDLAFCGLILGDGPCLLLAMHSLGYRRPSAIDGRWLRTTNSCSIVLEPRRMLACVGLNNGEVEQYYIGVPAGDNCPLMRKISLSNWYFESKDVGRPLILKWTDDGMALLVGWEKRGLAVWSVSGCRLMWTLPQVGGSLPTTPSVKKQSSEDKSQQNQLQQQKSGAMEQGVLSATWGPQGFCLWACPKYIEGLSPKSLRFCHIMEFTFLKNGTSGSSSSICQSDSSRLAMLGSDRVLLLRHSDNTINNFRNQQRIEKLLDQHDNDFSSNEGIGIESNDLFSWQHLLIPQDYLWKNWPPTSLAVSADESHIAVAGEHGVAICHVRSQRWRVFGDLDHGRQKIRCSALAWVGRTIVIGNEVILSSSSALNSQYGQQKKGYQKQDQVQKRHELLFYLRDQGESSTLQTQKILPSKPLLTDVRPDGYLLVMCEDARVFLFKMTEHYSRSRVDVREVYNLLLPTRESGLMYKQDVANLNTSDSTDSNAAENGDSIDNNDVAFIHESTPPAPGGGITQAKIFPPLTHTTTPRSNLSPSRSSQIGDEAPIPTHIMLLRSTGSLILLDTERMVSTALLRYVERFWYTPVDCTPFDMMPQHPIWWAYGDDGLHVCFKDVNQVNPNELTNAENGQLSPNMLAMMSPRAAIASSRKKKVEVEQWFELDAEVYPLAIMSKYGMLLGVTQGLVVNNVVEIDGSPIPRHTMQVKRQPILHTLLRHILMKPGCDERLALQIALKCVAQPQFVDSLEWLLYEAVLEHDEETSALNRSDITYSKNKQSKGESEINGNSTSIVVTDSDERNMSVDNNNSKANRVFPESPRRKKAGSGLFPRVIRLLKYFGEYEDVVVRCARKLDSKRWPLLFSLAGEPAALLEQCFVSGRLRTAACLLVILQEMWGFISSTPHSLRLVEAALARGEIDLAADLSNFLAKADQAGMLNSSQLRSIEDVSWIAEAVHAPKGSALSKVLLNNRNNKSINKFDEREEKRKRIPAVDLAVLNHIRWLMSRMELKNIVRVSLKMNFPLEEWLKRELKGKNASRPFVRDFGSTILSLHRQFQVTPPDLMDVRRAVHSFNMMEMNSSKTSATSTNSNDMSKPVSPSSLRRRLPCHNEVTYLMTVSRMARAPDLTLCCATLLLDISILKMVLKGYEELFGPYVTALKELNVSGYDALLGVMNEVVAMPK